MQEQVFTNYRLLLPDQEILGTLVVRDGLIADIQPGVTNHGLDGQRNFLLPGLVELHTDNLEKCMAPRPGVRWPLEAAALYHDRDLAAAGITTVCDAIALGDVEPGSPRLTSHSPMIDVITRAQQARRFAVDHHLHLRCELAYDRVYDLAAQYINNPLLALISLMDHTPGQRQFVKLDKFKQYYMGKHGVTAEQMEDFIQHRQREQQEHAERNRSALVALVNGKGMALASHDDATVEHVQVAVQDGVAIAEFPTTLEAANAAHESGLQILMGAPNLVLGGSHSGNVAAMDLVERNLVDLFSSDYVPHSLLHAPFLIAHKTGKPLHEAVNLVTLNPARAIGMDGDRGSLEVGKRADFVTVHCDAHPPQILTTVCQGRRIA
jgi:alpha-D-ribose 1-methylphosphonate 5-triphosphate diphosphatase